MTNEELTKSIVANVQAGKCLWTTAPAPKAPAPPNSTLESYVGNMPRIAIITTHWTENDRSGYTAMGTLNTGEGIFIVRFDDAQAEICFRSAQSTLN